jgi:SPP1 family phage portal protein
MSMVFDYLDSKRPVINVSGMTEKRFFELEIARWKVSEQRRQQIEGQNYYRGLHDVLSRQREVIGADCTRKTVENLPNNRIVDNQYAKMVVQKSNYLLGRKFIYSTENEKYQEALDRIFDNAFYRTLLNIAKSSLNCGIGWLYVYLDEAGELCFKRFNPWEILPFWTDETEHTELAAAVRVYEVESYIGGSSRLVENVEIYLPDGVKYYTLSNGTLVPRIEMPSAPYLRKGDEAKDWGKIPIVPFRYNDEELPLITKVKSLQDALNDTVSDFRNNMQEDYRSSILILQNYDGENLAEFRTNLLTYGAIKVRTLDGQAGGVTALKVDVNAESFDVFIRLVKKSIVENAMGYDSKDDKMAGAANQMNIQSMYNDIDLDANCMETEFQASFERLLYFITKYLGAFADEYVEIIFNRDMMMNEGDIIDNIKKSEGLLSRETLIAQNPWVTDVSAELERIEAENQAATASFQDSLAPSVDGEDKGKDDDGDAA